MHYEKFADGSVKCIEDEIPFELPEGWAWAKINTIAFVTKLAGFEYTKNIAPSLCEDGIPLFKGKNVQNSTIVYEFESFIPESVSDELQRSQVTKKCILTPYVGTIGNIGIHNRPGKYHLGSNVGKIELYNDNVVLLEEYVVAYLQSGFGYQQLTKHMKATAQASISIEAIRDVYLPIPPANEQLRMWSALSNALAMIERIENTELDITNLIKSTKSKILDLAIRGQLVPQDPTDEPAAVLLERIRAEKEELIKQGKINRDKKESVIFRGEDNSYYVRQGTHTESIDDQFIFDLPDNWKWCSLLNVAKIELGKTLDSVKNTGTNHPYLRSVNVRWNEVDLADLKEMRFEPEEVDRYTVRRNDLLICEGGDVGRSCVWTDEKEILYQNALHRVRFYGECNPFYFMYYMMYYESRGIIKALCKGVTIKHLTGNVLSLIPFALPPLEEQGRIVERLNQMFALLDTILCD